MENLIKKIESFGLLEFKRPKERRIFIRIRSEFLRDLISFLIKEYDLRHLSTITGVDLGEEIELLYHFAYKHSIEITIGIKVPKSSLKVPTITDLIPGAIFYEKEVHDMLGVVFEGHPDLSPLILPENWPEGVHPLRKNYSIEKLKELIKK
jgi:NADH:ubiquinone oxidoreductase subunit C